MGALPLRPAPETASELRTTASPATSSLRVGIVVPMPTRPSACTVMVPPITWKMGALPLRPAPETASELWKTAFPPTVMPEPVPSMVSTPELMWSLVAGEAVPRPTLPLPGTVRFAPLIWSPPAPPLVVRTE